MPFAFLTGVKSTSGATMMKNLLARLVPPGGRVYLQCRRPGSAAPPLLVQTWQMPLSSQHI